jgi:hypothetical protein
MSDEPERVYSATLMVLGDDLLPQRVTKLLGLEPSQSWRRGERKSFVRHGGTPHYFDSVHEWGGWKCLIPENKQGAELAEQLAWWCDVLEGREPAMRELEAQGCRLLMDCFVGAGESGSVEVSADLQRRLSGLRLNLTVCFSPDTRLPGGEAEQAAATDRE